MLQDPIVVRKSLGRFLVSSSEPNDPVQLIRQLDDTKLEVHLKNSTTYVEEVPKEELGLAILELIGYRKETVLIHFHAWHKDQDRFLNFKFTPAQCKKIGERLMSSVFKEVPFLNSKFLSLKVESTEKATKYYDTEYGAYDVTLRLHMWCRAEMITEVTLYIDEHARDLVEYACELANPGKEGYVLSNSHYAQYVV